MLTEFLAWLGFVGASGLVVSPLDLIPDVIPVISWADDAGYVLLALACAYIGWQQHQHTHFWQMQDAAQRGRPS
jgi:uncharacterized membrane protein YkvA (DUF1232 family)